MKKALVVFAVLTMVQACATHKVPMPVVPALQTDADYQHLWTAALGVVSERFEVTKAEAGTGVIETDWLVGPISETGPKLNTTRSHAADDALKTYRRRAFVLVSHIGKPLEVTVYRERLIRDHPEIQPGGKFTVRRPLLGTEGARTAWRSEGADDALAEKIYREIADRYLAGK